MLNLDDLEWSTKDLRVGMGIGGLNLSVTLKHKPTGNSITTITWNGFDLKTRKKLLTLMELLLDEDSPSGYRS